MKNTGSTRPDMAEKTEITLKNYDFSSTLMNSLSWNLDNWVLGM